MSTGLFSYRERQSGPRRGYIPKNRRLAADTLDRFADHLAEHGDTARAAAQIGKSPAYGRVLLQRLRGRLGWQAV